MKFLRAISRVVIGLTFLLSGFVKIIDPVGVGLIFEEYFKAAGVGELHTLALIAGVALSAAEMLLGITILAGIRMRYSASAVLFLISFFTVLTLILAIFNPVNDCGCFGEAIKLTNWETFYKNIVLLLFAVLLFLQREKYIPVAPPAWEWSFAAVFATGILLLSIYSYRHLPMIDFMEFKSGTNIIERLNFANNPERPQFETTLIYSKNGKSYEFTVDNLPDSTYTFVDSKTKQTGKGSVISDFAISDIDGNYITDSVLAISGAQFVISVPYPHKLNERHIHTINDFYEKLKSKSIPMSLLSGSGFKSTVPELRSLNADVYHTDLKTLLTLNRSNGGVVYLYDGTVITKWSLRDIPVNAIDKILAEDPELLSAKKRIKEQLSAELAALLLLLFIALMRMVCRLLYIYKPIECEKGNGDSSIAADSVIHEI